MQAGATKAASWQLMAFYAALAAIVVAPVMTVTLPVLGDLPNHLARVHILESLSAGGKLAAYYQRPDRLVPYQAMDAVMRTLRAVLPIYAAGRVFVALCMLVPPAAAAVLRYVTQGRVGLLPAAGFLLSYNYLLSRGFLDYLFAAGLAVALFATWLAMARAPRWARAAVCGPGLAVVFLAHAYAGVAYCILVAGDQVAAAVRRRWRPASDIARDWAAAAAQTVPCLVLVVGFGASGAFGGAAQTHFGTLADKIAALLTPVMFPWPHWIFRLLAVLVLVVVVLLAARRVRIAPCLAGPIIAVALAEMAAPRVLFNAWATDMRLPLVLYILVLAGMMPARALSRRVVSLLLAALIVLVCARAAGALVLLQKLDVQAAEVRGLVQTLPQGARLLVVDDAQDSAHLRVVDYLFTDHLGLLATLDRDAFVPFLLTDATPVQVRPDYRAAASPNARPVTLAQLREGAAQRDVAGALVPYGYGGHEYWNGWRSKFDYVLVMNFGAQLTDLPAGLRMVAQVPVAALYRIDKK
jgi:hypothetical protein